MSISNHSLAIQSDGSVWTWGYNIYGQLGDNTRTAKSSPIAVAGSRSFDEISAGRTFSLARIAVDGSVWSWGNNSAGQLGDNTMTSKSSPVAVAGSRSFDEISAGYYHSLARMDSDGSVWAWGDGYNGQLGNNSTNGKSSPVAVAGSRSFDEISVGDSFSLARMASDGSVWAWGMNSSSQLGDNTTTDKSSPVAVAGNRSFNEISVGSKHSLARMASDGSVWAWGYNAYGQLGDNTRTDKSSPVAVVGGRSFDEIYAGTDFSLARMASDGSVWAWGRNLYGQLGDNTTVSKSSPVAVAGGRSFREILAGNLFSLARMSDGSVWSWGDNTYGQLGDNTVTNQSSPTAVVGGYSFSTLSKYSASSSSSSKSSSSSSSSSSSQSSSSSSSSSLSSSSSSCRSSSSSSSRSSSSSSSSSRSSSSSSSSRSSSSSSSSSRSSISSSSSSYSRSSSSSSSSSSSHSSSSSSSSCRSSSSSSSSSLSSSSSRSSSSMSSSSSSRSSSSSSSSLSSSSSSCRSSSSSSSRSSSSSSSSSSYSSSSVSSSSKSSSSSSSSFNLKPVRNATPGMIIWY